MAISVSQWVWDHSESSHGSRLVLLAIADAVREDRIKDGAWPSVAWLMRRTRLKERAVHSAIADLEKLGELRVARNAGPKGCNLYHVVMPRTPAKSAPLQKMHPAKSAPPQNLHRSESLQVDEQMGAESAPPADIAGVQKTTSAPAESAPETGREPEGKSSTRSRRDLNAGREDVERLCIHLADRVQANDPDGKRPSIGKQWRDAARLMLDADHRGEDKVHRAIDWCQSNEFWRRNIQSMPKLREQYARLQMQADAERKGSANGHGPKPPRAANPDRPDHMVRR